jgi:pSer/pThr/pTyr-binding forkhead associated (FHA) protein
LVLGRAPGTTGLVLEGPAAGLSREHCQLLRVGSEAVVEDLSTYGTWLNGERVRRRSRLRVGDVLRLGVPGVELALLAVQSAAPGEPLASSVPVALERN